MIYYYNIPYEGLKYNILTSTVYVWIATKTGFTYTFKFIACQIGAVRIVSTRVSCAFTRIYAITEISRKEIVIKVS